MDVLVSLRDPSWNGSLLPQHLDDAAYLYTDIFLGIVTLQWFDGEDSRALRNAGAPTGVFGALKALIDAVAGEVPVTVHSYLGAELYVVPQGERVEVRSNIARDVVLAPRREDVVGELSRCLDATRRLVRVSYGTEPYPQLIDGLSV